MILCGADATCPMQAKHTVVLRFSTWKDDNGNYGRQKAIPVCDSHTHPYQKVQPGELLPGHTSVTLVSFTRNALRGENWQ